MFVCKFGHGVVGLVGVLGQVRSGLEIQGGVGFVWFVGFYN